MRLRAAIRYQEFKSADKLPSSIPTDCAVCIEKDQYEKYNCDGEGNPNYVAHIGNMEFYQCPLSLPTDEAWMVIDLVSTCLESGIPIVGTDLMGQTKHFFKFKNIITSERADCQRELFDLTKKDTNKRTPGIVDPQGNPVAAQKPRVVQSGRRGPKRTK